ATLAVVERSRFASAFTFQYSPRPGTPAADLPDQVPPEVVAERYQRLVALQERISAEENAAQVGRSLDVLVAEHDGRKDADTRRSSGRAEAHRPARLALPADLAEADLPRPGGMVTATVTGSAPRHLRAV